MTTPHPAPEDFTEKQELTITEAELVYESVLAAGQSAVEKLAFARLNGGVAALSDAEAEAIGAFEDHGISIKEALDSLDE